jgi:hypothetical protein
MFKWSELTTTGKGIRVLSIIAGFASGTVLGGTVSNIMVEKGQNVIISNACGMACTALYTKFFETMGDIVIDANDEHK